MTFAYTSTTQEPSDFPHRGYCTGVCPREEHKNLLTSSVGIKQTKYPTSQYCVENSKIQRSQFLTERETMTIRIRGKTIICRQTSDTDTHQ